MTDGIILLDKPAGQTSFQALGAVKRRLGTGRVGHAGTLDKFAEGLLIVLAGRMTRMCAFAMSLDKEYIAVVTFGRETDTLDPEGRVVSEGPVPVRDSLVSVLPEFRGTISQVPPAYSAIHVNGKRASEMARGGQSPQLPPRSVRIDSLELLDYAPPEATLRICCSKGTYVRSLARDIARRLGTCAHVSRLQRIRIGGFGLENAVRPDCFEPRMHLLGAEAFFDAAPELHRVTVKPEWALAVSTGRRLVPEYFEQPLDTQGIFGAFSPEGRLLAVVENAPDALRYAAAFPLERAGEPS